MVIGLKLFIIRACFRVMEGRRKTCQRFYLMIANPSRALNLSEKPTEESWGKPRAFMKETRTSYKCQKDRKPTSASLRLSKRAAFRAYALPLWDTQRNY